MALPPASKQIVANWLKNRCPALKCAACGGANLEIDEIVVVSPKVAPKGLLAGRGPTLEYIPLVCAQCGSAMFFSNKAIGLTV
jgi:predicted nucleic-acid-binding Zn-ribbon protein